MVNACSRATHTIENTFKGVVNATLETDLLERIKAIVMASLVLFKVNAPVLSRSIGFLGLGGSIQDLYELCKWLDTTDTTKVKGSQEWSDNGDVSTAKEPLTKTAMKGFFVAARILRMTQFLDFIAISEGLKSMPVSTIKIPRVGGLPIGMAADLLGFVGCSLSLYNHCATYRTVAAKMSTAKNQYSCNPVKTLVPRTAKDNINLNALKASVRLGIIDDVVTISGIALAYTSIVFGHKALGEAALTIIRLRLLSGITGVTKIAFDSVNKDAIEFGKQEMSGKVFI